MAKEMITAMSAAQRLKMSVEEVNKLWKDGKLKGKKEFSQLYIEKESVYEYSGLSEGKQNKKGAGRKPNVMTFEAAAEYLGVDMRCMKKIVEDGEVEVAVGKGGVRGPKEAQVKMFKKKLEGREDVMQKTEEKSTKNENGADGTDTKDTTASTSERAASSDEVPAKDTKEILETKIASSPKNSQEPETTTGTEKVKPGGDEDAVGDESSATAQRGDKLGVELGDEVSLDDVIQALFGGTGVKLMSKQMRAEALTSRFDSNRPLRYTKHEMNEVAGIAYKMGRLAVYEEMESFTRVKPAKLIKKKVK